MSETNEPGEGSSFPAESPEPESIEFGSAWRQPAGLQAVTGPAPILVSIARPVSQPRLTVAFRAILAIPQYIAIAVLSVAAGVTVFIGWWAALFTGQLPESLHTFITGVLRWTTRAIAYSYLLTGTYPPFDLEDSDYPVRLVAKRTRLNRLAVLFRIFLLIPAGLLSGVSMLGALIMSPAAWLITLVTGRLPDPLHQAFAAIIRYQARYTGYGYLITPEYPGGLFGDQPPVAMSWPGDVAPAEPAEAETAPAEAGTAQAEAEAEPAEPAPAEPAPIEAAAAAEAPAAEAPAGELAAPAVQAADAWRLTVAGTARGLIVLAIVLGVGGYAADIAVTTSLANNSVSRAQALTSITTAARTLDAVTTQFPSQTAACGNNVTCVTTLDGKVADAFTAFSSSVQNAGVPSQFSAQTSALVSSSNKVAQDFRRLAGATSAAQYRTIFTGLSLQSDVGQWQLNASQLHTSLSRH